jgi:hypothetical protein
VKTPSITFTLTNGISRSFRCAVDLLGFGSATGVAAKVTVPGAAFTVLSQQWNAQVNPGSRDRRHAPMPTISGHGPVIW